MITKQLLPLGRVFLQKVANLGNTRAAIISPTSGGSVTGNLQLALWDDKGRTAIWNLANASNNVSEACCALLEDRLIVATRVQTSQTTILEYKLATDPFAAEPSYLSKFLSGDDNSRGCELIVLFSKEVVCVTYQHTDMRCYVAARTTAGVWSDHGPFALSNEKGTSHQFSACAAPWGATEFWVFDTMDAGLGIACGMFTLENGKPTMFRNIPIIKPTGMQITDQWNVNGEVVSPVATTDYIRKQILLSYTNNEWKENIDQMAYPVVVGIKQDGVPYGIYKAPEVVISILNKCPIVVTPNGVELHYRAGRPCVTYVMGSTRLDTKDCQVAWNQYAKEVLYATPNNQVMLTSLEAVVPVPVPTPISLVSIQIQLAAFSNSPNLIWTSDVEGKLGTGNVMKHEFQRKDQTITVTDGLSKASLKLTFQ